MKIYTRTGDDGSTALFAGGRVSKTDLRVACYGTVDELNSLLGVVRALKPNEQSEAWLAQVQNQLLVLGADLATPLDARSQAVVRVGAEATAWLEAAIDRMDETLPPLKTFILPGGTPVAAHLHVARTVCRRAERLAVALAQQGDIGPHALPYLNRLSDFLFTLARWENLRAGEPEQKWQARDS